MIIKRLVTGPGVPKASSPLSQAVVAEGALAFIAGQVGRDPGTGNVPTDFIEQTKQALANLRSVLDALGAKPRDVVRVLVFVTDLSQSDEFNRVYREFFGEEFPSRTRVQVAALAPGFQVEMEAITVVPKGA
jgi:2-iminobutanoate/2-iminopropanoate deaminase